MHSAVAGCPYFGTSLRAHTALAQYANTEFVSNHVGAPDGAALGMAQLACGGVVGAATTSDA